jgi:hypothetical protein
MTRKKTMNVYSDLELAQYRLRVIAHALETGSELGVENVRFLIDALWRIGRGEDPTAVLGVKGKRGQRRTSKEQSRGDNVRYALSFVAAVMRPEGEGGKGLSLDTALERATTFLPGQANFGITEDTLRAAWTTYPEWRTPSFPRPLPTIPDRQPRDFDPKSRFRLLTTPEKGD